MAERRAVAGGSRLWRPVALSVAGAALVLGIAGLVAWHGTSAVPGSTPTVARTATSGGDGSASGATVARRETRPTLDPALFVGKARAAHQVAREIPDVLDRLYCYCECDKHAGHKSLLSCFTDGHAAT